LSYTKKLSFIIPAYNCAAFMDETFGSVLSQLRSDCELIAVEDGKGKLKHSSPKRSFFYGPSHAEMRKGECYIITMACKINNRKRA
jgi:hypothetical protein